MQPTSRMSGQKPWQPTRRRVSVLAEMALRRERVVERLTELREQHNLTQEQAAQKVGITYRQWQRWESGDSMPYPRSLDQVASAFGISVQEFFDGQPDGTQIDRLERDLAAAHTKLDRILNLLEQYALEQELAGGLDEHAERTPARGSAAA